jgi:putative mRNA 3-end processing factor
LGNRAPRAPQPMPYGQVARVGAVDVSLHPAGHVLGSAQVLLSWARQRVVVSGDYKRVADPTCASFEAVPCDVFITEATFGLPVFRHPPPMDEIGRLTRSLRLFPERSHLVGAYSLGKAQRMIALLRRAGLNAPVYAHPTLADMCALYERHGVSLGEVRSLASSQREGLAGAVVLAPPGTLRDERWARRLVEPLSVAASGWMRVARRARTQGGELPLIISDHADWDELLATIDDTQASEVWVTHGQEDALVHAVRQSGRRAQALAMVGYEEEDGL